jgi:hypothetical protein
MGLSWQQGPLSSEAIGRFLVPEPMPKRLLYAEPLRRRMRVPETSESVERRSYFSFRINRNTSILLSNSEQFQ